MADRKSESMEIEAGWIRELAAILDETGLTEVEIEKDKVRLRVSRAGGGVAAYAPAPAPAAANPQGGGAASPEIPAASAPQPRGADHPGAVPSPMVGTAYLSPSPGAAPFVKKGDQVNEGQTLLIVEAMKTMNPIAAPRGGVVTDILVSDSQPVEFGETLLIIE